ncbi:MAG: 6-phosphogluconate dehydrogenase [Bacteroidota bacterium]|nr:6-phosphogluconate dehydrogenase [Bacteroidota bacterium]
MQNFWKRTKIVLLILFLIGIAVLSYFVFGSFSEGSRAGTIIKFSKKGVIFKTYEGELNMGMFITDNAAANYGSNIFNFSVPSDNKAVIETIEKVILTGSRVKLYYQEKYVSFLWVGDTKYHIYKIDVLEK